MKCFAGLVQGAKPEIVAALDVDSGEVHAGWRISQEVAQAVDNAGVERLRRIGGEVPQEAIGAAGGIEVGSFHEERMLKLDLAAANPEIIHPLGVIAHDGVPEPIGGTGEFLSNARVRGRIKALIGGEEVLAQQLGQELVVGDMRDLRADNGASFLIEVVTGPVRMLQSQLIDLVIMLAHEQGLQRGQARIFRRPHIAGQRQPTGGIDRQVASRAGLHVAVGQPQTVQRSLVGTVDHAGVEPAGDLVDRGLVGRIDNAAGHRDDRAVREQRVAVRHRDIDVVDAIGIDPVEVVVDKLPP